MYIANFAGCFTDEFNDHRAKTDIGNKAAVHNIKVEPISLALLYDPQFVEAKEALNIVLDKKGGLERLTKIILEKKVVTDEINRIRKQWGRINANIHITSNANLNYQ